MLKLVAMLLVGSLACGCWLGCSTAVPPTHHEVRFDPAVSPQLRVDGGGIGSVYIWAEVNDQLAGWFLLDTGMAGMWLSPEAAEQLELKLEPAGRIGGVGASVKAWRAQAETLCVGPMTLTSPSFMVAPIDPGRYRHKLGVLGGAILSESVVVYDCAGPSVSLYDPAVFEEPPVEWEACQFLDGKPFTAMKIEGQDVLLEIDTGGGEAVLLCTPAALRLGLDDGRDVVQGLVHGPYGSAPVRSLMLDRFDVGALGFEDVPGTLGVEDTGWLGSTDHDGLIGAPLLCQMVAIFDYGRERISLTDRRLYGLMEDGVEWAEYSGFTASQVTGQPDAMDSATYDKAWFPADEDGKHWLELTYADPITPQRLEVWGTVAQPGIAAIHGVTESGERIAIEWSGVVQETRADGLAQTVAEIKTSEPVVQLRLDIDCSVMAGNNAIDAVGLVDRAGATHWAQEARANSSLYKVAVAPFSPREALEAHAVRLSERERTKAAATVEGLLKGLDSR